MRHPFDRLLSTWRHIFHSGGWRLLERQFVDNPELAKDFEAAYENITWPLFVRELVLKPQTPLPDLNSYDSPGVWIRWVKKYNLHSGFEHSFRHHWAPYWYTCGVCQESRAPDYLLKIETMEEDIVFLFEHEFQMFGEDYLFPRVKTLGTKNKVGEVNPENLIETYFGQLQKEDVLQLYRFYEIDFKLFGYSPQLYLQHAK